MNERADVSILVKHTRQNGTVVFVPSDVHGAGRILHDNGFRTSRNLPFDETVGEEAPGWYMPHTRRRTANWRLGPTVAALREAWIGVEVSVDDTTPATGFSDLEAERADRAEARADRYSGRAQARADRSQSLRTSVQQTVDQLNGTPILVGHYSEGAHRRLMERLWSKESKAWELYEQAKYWHAKAESAARYSHRREDPATTLRRIKGLEKRLRGIAAAADGTIEVLWDNPLDWPGPVAEQLRKYQDKGIPVTVLSETDNGDGTRNVRVHIGLSDHTKAVHAAEVFEITDEITYWQAVLDASGAKIWTKADFKRGDFITAGGNTWYEVARVNAASVAVAALLDRDAGPVRTLAALAARSRSAPPTQKLPYDKVTGKMTAQEARDRFPAAFAAPLETVAEPPKRPARKRGTVKMTHQPGPMGDNWFYTVAGVGYRAYWPHPDGWNGGGAVTGEIPEVKVFERVAFIGKPDIDTGHRIPVTGPLHYVEQVHNLVRAFVEEAARTAAPMGA